MGNLKVLNEEPVSLVEAKSELAKIKKRDGELSFRANKVDDYLNTFAKDSMKKHNEYYEALDKLKIPRLKEIHIRKLIDIKPATIEDVKLVLQGYTLTVTQDNIKKITKVFND